MKTLIAIAGVVVFIVGLLIFNMMIRCGDKMGTGCGCLGILVGIGILVLGCFLF